MKTFLRIFIISFLAASVASCNRQEDNYSEASGELVFSVGKISYEIGSRAEYTDIPVSTDDLKVVIVNADDETVRSYDSPADVPAAIKLSPGDYTVSAFYGSAETAGFDAYFVYGSQRFTIRSGASVSVSVECVLANVRVSVDYGENIRERYSDFYTTVWEVSHQNATVRFNKDEDRAGYVPSGLIQVKVFLIDEDQSIRASLSDPFPVDGQTHLRLQVDLKPAEPGSVGIKITLNDEANEIDIPVELPGFLLPDAPPEFTFTGIQSGVTVSLTEGYLPEEASLNIAAPGRIASLQIIPSPSAVALGWPSSVDLVAASEDTETAEKLRALGLTWPADLAGARLARLDLLGFIAALSSTDGVTDYEFTMKATDQHGQETEEATLKFEIAEPRFSIEPIPSGDVWARRVFVNAQIADANPDLLSVEVEHEGVWKTFPFSTETKTPTGALWEISELPSGTPLNVRLKYNDHRSESIAVTTEEDPQIPNSDFEAYCQYKWNGSENLAQYYWHPDGATNEEKWWSTRNPATAAQVTGFSLGGAPNDYTRHNQATPVANGENNMAIELQTTVWGRGTTSLVSGGGTKKNYTSGILFIGDYEFTYSETSGSGSIGEGLLTSETLNQGRPFGSRPAKFQFQYKYSRISGSDEYFIAYAVIEHRDGENVYELGRASVPESVAIAAVSNMTDKSADFSYDENYKHLKATHVSIFFSSSNKLGGTIGERPSTTNSGTGTRHYGNILTIDNLRLDYNF